MTDTRWLARFVARPGAGLRLICLPHAGGGAATFRAWASAIGPSVEVVAVRLPGRENRYGEPRYRRMDAAVPALASAVRPHLDRPWALFGHSLGGLVAFALANHLARLGERPPRHVFAAASRAPHWTPVEFLHTLPDDALLARVHRLGGLPPDALADEELMRLLLPVIRDDLEIGETYRADPADRLDCPVTVLAGADDPAVPGRELAAWQDACVRPIVRHVLPGDHFFVHSTAERVVQLIRTTMEASDGLQSLLLRE